MTDASSQMLKEKLKGRRVGLVLSSAYFGFYAHAGFVRGLQDEGINFAACAGSSSGSLIAAFTACNALDEAVPTLLSLQRRDFWDPSMPVRRPWGLLRGDKLQRIIKDALPVKRFEECQTPLLTVSTDLTNGRRKIDETGDLAPAITSSCALPFLFQPVIRNGIPYADGGIIDKAPIEALIDRNTVDAVVVHLIHSKSIGKKAPVAPRRFLNWSLDVCRHSAWQTQARLAEQMGIDTYIIESEPSKLGPFKMKEGRTAFERSRARIVEKLQQPARLFRSDYLIRRG